MVYVYPLKIMFSAAFSFMSNGWLPASFELDSLHQFRVFVTIFGIGMATLSGLIAALYGYAWTKRDELEMHAAERFDTAAESIVWLVIGSFGLFSVTLAWLLPDRLLHLSTWVYWMLIVIGPVLDKVQDRLVSRRLPAD
jgi:cytochrome bd-type quinol oxidase subunit 2